MKIQETNDYITKLSVTRPVDRDVTVFRVIRYSKRTRRGALLVIGEDGSSSWHEFAAYEELPYGTLEIDGLTDLQLERDQFREDEQGRKWMARISTLAEQWSLTGGRR